MLKMKSLLVNTWFLLLTAAFLDPTVAMTTTTNSADTILQRFGISKIPASSSSLEYSIFRGHSSLRDLPDACQNLLLSSSSLTLTLTKSAKAILLFVGGHADASHEVLLGVTLTNVKQAEYAATHRGQTNWAQDHPLDDVNDHVHSILHRSEGESIGEGGHTGYENAKYWAAGGPKSSSTHHQQQQPVYGALCRLARQKTPLCVAAGVIATGRGGRFHEILADGGKRRTVHVPKGCWDPFCFIDIICRRQQSKQEEDDDDLLQSEINYLQDEELELLLQHELGEGRGEIKMNVKEDDTD